MLETSVRYNLLEDLQNNIYKTLSYMVMLAGFLWSIIAQNVEQVYIVSIHIQ